MNFDNDSGAIGQLAQWIEYPFVTKDFPLVLFFVIAVALFILIYCLHDGVQVVAETVGEMVPS